MQVQRVSKLFQGLVSRSVARRNVHVENAPVTTMNDLPSPSGSWQTNYDAHQRRYNAHLLFGIVFTVGSIILANLSGALYMNYEAPKKPSGPLTYKN